MGLAMSGSQATNCASKPGGSLKSFFSSPGVRASVGATTGGSSHAKGPNKQKKNNKPWLIMSCIQKQQFGGANEDYHAKSGT
jgi:hypothetical protein